MKIKKIKTMSLRFDEDLLKEAKIFALEHGYRTFNAFVRDCLSETMKADKEDRKSRLEKKLRALLDELDTH